MSTINSTSLSYWKQGCEDAKQGKPYNESMRWANGYDNGFYWGQHGKSRPDPFLQAGVDEDDTDISNPYMEAIEFIEGLMEDLPTNGLDDAVVDEYRVNLLEVRDTLHRFRQAEMGQVGQS